MRRIQEHLKGLFDAALTYILVGAWILPVVQISLVLSPRNYLADLLSNFQLQFLSFGIFGLLLSVQRRSRLGILGACLACGISLLQIAPLYFPGAGSLTLNNPSLRLMFANVQTSNQNRVALLEIIDKLKPTIVGFSEVDNSWKRTLDRLLPSFPYSHVIPRADNFGIAIYSSLPLEKVESVEFSPSGVPAIAADVSLSGEPVRVLIIHTLPPARRVTWEDRNQMLKNLADYIAKADRPIVVLGDLNITPWSIYFKEFLSQSGLTDSRTGRGLLTTWPTHIPPLSIPIDYCLHSKQIVSQSAETTQSYGSDHRAIYCDLVAH